MSKLESLPAAAVQRWVERLFARHERELQFREISRGLAALPQDYVQRRQRLGQDAFEGRGKRAAFACYYGPVHYLLLRRVLRDLGVADGPVLPALDLGCGSGVAGAAWAGLFKHPSPMITGIEPDRWALAEARETWSALGLRGKGIPAPLERRRWPSAAHVVLGAYVVNELPPAAREKLKRDLLAQAARGWAIFIVEPLATKIVPWWFEWTAAFRALGGRVDEWRYALELPERVALLGKAAGLDPPEHGCRTLWVPAKASPEA